MAANKRRMNMFGEYYPECGHLLTKNQSACLFCGWDESSDLFSFSFEVENDLACLDRSEVHQDQLPGL